MFGRRSCCLLLLYTIRTRRGILLYTFEKTITLLIHFILPLCRLNNTHPTICRRIFVKSRLPPSNLYSDTSETHIVSLLQEATSSRSRPSVTIVRSQWPSKGASTSSNSIPYHWPTWTANHLPCLQAQTRCLSWSRRIFVDVGNFTMSVSFNRDCVHAPGNGTSKSRTKAQSDSSLSPMMERWEGESNQDQPFNNVGKFSTIREADNKQKDDRHVWSNLG